MTTETRATASKPAQAVSFRQWYLVAVLTTIYMLSFLDRGALNLMVNPIKADLGISDTQISLLLGLAFLMLFSISSIPFGYAADKYSRRTLIGGAVLFWSCMSAMCGFAGSYWTLFAGRTGLGIGEAALQPSGFSLVRDSFPPERRARAFSIYQTGSVLGTGAATLVGGALFGLAASGAIHNIPILGSLRPWQFAIAVPGLCGIPLAFLLLTIREPARTKVASGAETPSFGDLYRYVRLHWRVYLPLVGATTTVALATGGWTAWVAAGIGRSWSMSPSQIGHIAGPITMIGTPIGVLTMGYVMERLARKGFKDGAVRVMFATQLIGLIPTLLLFQMTTESSMWVVFACAALMGGGSGMQVGGASIVSDITPGRLMGKLVATYNLIQVVLGLALGPTVYALVSDNFFTGKRAIVDAMMLCYGTAVSVALVLLLILMRQVRRWHQTNQAT